MLTTYLKEIAFNPLKARAILNAPTLLEAETGLTAEHVSALTNRDMQAINSIISKETADVHGLKAEFSWVITITTIANGFEQSQIH